jgi:hypothetical protein
MDVSLTLPGGGTLAGSDPVVVIGPNGSGKTRQTRNLGSAAPIEFINALRNTRVAPELPAVGVETARNNFTNQKNQSRGQHWELSNEFDYMLSQLLAQQSMAAIDFMRKFQTDRATAGEPEATPLSRVEALWADVFPGRGLYWRDWKPLIRSHTSGAEVEYSANQMSDGEKAALYLAGRVLSAEPGVLVVDEPETHFHSMLAVRLWDALEKARPDIRFVYVTHDLTFALSRRNARLVLASPFEGLRPLAATDTLPDDVSEALVGSASLSFYASRVVFVEGDASSIDAQLYSTWFSGPDTVIRSVGGCHRVLRCVDVAAASGITSSLQAIGIVDGDYHPDAFLESLPTGVHPLRVHEAEALLCLPAIVAAVCAHVSQPFDETSYEEALKATVSDQQAQQITIERWKRRLEPQLEALVSGVSSKTSPVEELITEIPTVFDHETWSFSPAAILEEERERVSGALAGSGLATFLKVVPGKQLLPVAARHARLDQSAYVKLICDALADDSGALQVLGASIAAVLAPLLPQRFTAIKTVAVQP